LEKIKIVFYSELLLPKEDSIVRRKSKNKKKLEVTPE